MALLSTLTDTFEDGVLAPMWSTSGIVTELGGRARLRSDTGTQILQTAREHTIAGSSVHIQAFPAPLGNATTAVWSQMVIQGATAGTRLLIAVYQDLGTIRFHNQTGYWDSTGTSITYDPVAHRWWRIRESAGTTYFDTSPDGTTWTNRKSVATPAWVGTDLQNLILSTHRDNGDAANYYEIDNLNHVPVSASAPATPTGLSFSSADTTATVSWAATTGAADYEVEYRPIKKIKPWTRTILTAPAQSTWTAVSGATPVLSNTGHVVTCDIPPSMTEREVVLSYGTGTVAVKATRATSGIVKDDGSVTPLQIRNIPPAPRTRVPLPAKVVGGYWENWGTLALGSVPAGYNVLYLSFAIAQTSGTGLVRFSQSVQTAASFRSDIQAVQAGGRPVLLSVGGWTDGGISLLTEKNVNDMVDTVAAIVEDYGLDGVDWDLEHQDAIKTATLYQASLKLKKKLGNNLLITTAFTLNSVHSRRFLQLMGEEMDLAGVMFYDYPATSQDVIDKTTELITTYGADPNQISVGYMITDPNQELTPATMASTYDTLEASYPTLRGVYHWDVNLDAGLSYQFLSDVAPAVTNT